MARFAFRMPAPHETTFAARAFDNQIGKTIQVNVKDWSGPGILIAAEVADDGRSVLLTVDCEGVPDNAFASAVAGPDLFPNTDR